MSDSRSHTASDATSVATTSAPSVSGHVTLKERAVARAYMAGWKLTRVLPAPVSRWLFEKGADLASGNGVGPEQLRKNLARVVGSENVTRELVRDSMRSYMRYWREAFMLPSLAGPELARTLNLCFPPGGTERLTTAVAEGRGVVLLLPHSGNWDMAGIWLVDTHGEFTTVAERLKPEELFQAFVDYRESLGFNVIALTGSATPPMERMSKVLRDGGVVCLLGERDLSGKGVLVDFFGETTSMPVGAAKLAQDTGAVLAVARCNFAGGGTERESWDLDISEPIDTTGDLQTVVQRAAKVMEKNIADRPQDWHMLQPLWLSDLSEERRRRVLDGATKQPSAESGKETR